LDKCFRSYRSWRN